MFNYSNIASALKEVIMSEKINDKQRSTALWFLCTIGLLVGISFFGLSMAYLLKILFLVGLIN